jgi:hypothetical protein
VFTITKYYTSESDTTGVVPTSLVIEDLNVYLQKIIRNTSQVGVIIQRLEYTIE